MRLGNITLIYCMLWFHLYLYLEPKINVTYNSFNFVFTGYGGTFFMSWLDFLWTYSLPCNTNYRFILVNLQLAMVFWRTNYHSLGFEVLKQGNVTYLWEVFHGCTQFNLHIFKLNYNFVFHSYCFLQDYVIKKMTHDVVSFVPTFPYFRVRFHMHFPFYIDVSSILCNC